jgi:DNA-binding transcriptional LysR family regulator
MLIVPRGHELAGKKRLTLRDLARHAFVIPPAGSTSRRLIEAAFLRAGLSLEIAMEAGGWEIMNRLVRAGMGVAVVPRWWRFRRGTSSLRNGLTRLLPRSRVL